MLSRRDLIISVGGDERDTTTPRGMADTLAAIATGDVLKPASRDLLIEWMVKTRTGDKRIRAGLPKDWRAGDKTGTLTGDETTDKYNDAAIAYPPGRSALVVTAFYGTGKRFTDIRDEDQAVLAEVGRPAASW